MKEDRRLCKRHPEEHAIMVRMRQEMMELFAGAARRTAKELKELALGYMGRQMELPVFVVDVGRPIFPGQKSSRPDVSTC